MPSTLLGVRTNSEREESFLSLLSTQAFPKGSFRSSASRGDAKSEAGGGGAGGGSGGTAWSQGKTVLHESFSETFKSGDGEEADASPGRLPASFRLTFLRCMRLPSFVHNVRRRADELMAGWWREVLLAKPGEAWWAQPSHPFEGMVPCTHTSVSSYHGHVSAWFGMGRSAPPASNLDCPSLLYGVPRALEACTARPLVSDPPAPPLFLLRCHVDVCLAFRASVVPTTLPTHHHRHPTDSLPRSCTPSPAGCCGLWLLSNQSALVSVEKEDLFELPKHFASHVYGAWFLCLPAATKVTSPSSASTSSSCLASSASCPSTSFSSPCRVFHRPSKVCMPHSAVPLTPLFRFSRCRQYSAEPARMICQALGVCEQMRQHRDLQVDEPIVRALLVACGRSVNEASDLLSRFLFFSSFSFDQVPSVCLCRAFLKIVASSSLSFSAELESSRCLSTSVPRLAMPCTSSLPCIRPGHGIRTSQRMR